jgi:bis(5'-nucleosidyl)-tetraphosphatase
MKEGILAILYKKKAGKLVYCLFNRKEGWKGWEFLKGGIEEGETPDDALIREVREEANPDYTFKWQKTNHIIQFNNGKEDVKLYVYYVKLHKKTNIYISPEHSEFGAFEYEEALEKLAYNNLKSLLKQARRELKGCLSLRIFTCRKILRTPDCC